jgi:hypothetical protein
MSPRSRRIFLSTALLACGSSCLQAQETLYPVPRNAYPGDHVFVPLPGGGGCNDARLDPARPPQIQRLRHVPSTSPAYDRYQYQVHYWLVQPPDGVCGTPPPPPTFLLDIGELPLGWHEFDVSGRLNDQPFASFTTGDTWVQRHQWLPQDLNGLWYDPAQSGRGLSVTRLGHDRAALLWFTHDAQGGTDWVASTADKLGGEPRLSGSGFNTRGAPPAPGAVTLTQQSWGELEFDYLGCGRARLSWTPRDPAIPPGSQMLQKLAQDYLAETCAPHADARAIWTGR